jgi:hypothetical protein
VPASQAREGASNEVAQGADDANPRTIEGVESPAGSSASSKRGGRGKPAVRLSEGAAVSIRAAIELLDRHDLEGVRRVLAAMLDPG